MTIYDHPKTGHRYLLDINPHYLEDHSDPVNTIDARWIDMATGLYIDITTFRKHGTTIDTDADNILKVKDGHHYLFVDIFPLRDDVFEDAPAKVPYNYAGLLAEEYEQKALTETLWMSHRFDSTKQAWVPLKHVYVSCCGRKHYCVLTIVCSQGRFVCLKS